jgi:site-specific DNA recombinase
MAEWIVSVGQHPGLIASAQWIQVQEALARNGSSAYRSPRKNEALLTGLLFCSCGSRMYPKLTGSRQNSGIPAHNYVCKRKERTRKGDCSCPNASGSGLDEAVWGQIQKLRPHIPTFVKQLEKHRHLCSEASQGWESQCQSLQEALAANDKKLENLLDAISLPQTPETKQRIARRMEELDQANHQLRRRIAALQNMLASCRLTPEELDALQGSLRAFDRCAAKMPVEEKRQTLRLAVQKVIWDGSSATLVLTGTRITGKNADKI